MHFEKLTVAVMRCIEFGFMLAVPVGIVSAFFATLVWLDTITLPDRKAEAWLTELSFIQLLGMMALSFTSFLALSILLFFVFSHVPLSWKMKAQRRAIFLAGIAGGWLGTVEKWLAIIEGLAAKVDRFVRSFVYRAVFCIAGLLFVYLSIVSLLEGLWIMATWLLVAGCIFLFVFLKWKTFTSWENILCVCRNLVRNFRKK